MPDFVFVQWIAPLVSEFPEMLSTLYWARRSDRAPMALMNMVSSNINQWTLLAAMLPIVYSISVGAVTPITFDAKQRMELWLTLGQAAIALVFLLNMELAWWEATALAVLFAIPFFSSAAEPVITWIYFGWAGVEVVRMHHWPAQAPSLPALRKGVERSHPERGYWRCGLNQRQFQFEWMNLRLPPTCKSTACHSRQRPEFSTILVS